MTDEDPAYRRRIGETDRQYARRIAKLTPPDFRGKLEITPIEDRKAKKKKS